MNNRQQKFLVLQFQRSNCQAPAWVRVDLSKIEAWVTCKDLNPAHETFRLGVAELRIDSRTQRSLDFMRNCIMLREQNDVDAVFLDESDHKVGPVAAIRVPEQNVDGIGHLADQCCGK